MIGAAAAYLVINAVMLARFGVVAWRDFFRGNSIDVPYALFLQRNAGFLDSARRQRLVARVQG